MACPVLLDRPGSRHRLGRVAFLTPEFPTESMGSGGVGNYVLKMATALTQQQVVAEVFVPSTDPGTVTFRGIRVERVCRERSLPARGAARALAAVAGPRSALVLHLADARRLARALAWRHAEQPFDVVQSSNLYLTGLFVPRAAGRRRVIRISTSRLLYDQAYGLRHAALSRLIESLDVHMIRRADVAYAPSYFLAEHFNRVYDTDVQVLRPPAELGAEPADGLPIPLPDRYFVHFGNLGRRKGTDVVAQALPLAWRVEPGLEMVWIGRIDERSLADFRAGWGAARERVSVVGALAKPELYRVLQGAIASVLPSRVDNLPNTAIESLVLGVPVIGSDGASIDELVEPGASGTLVPIGDAAALAAAMVEAWQGRASWTGGGFRSPRVLHSMQPDEAVRRFVELTFPAPVASR
jgi:glycosyltransferase involved in cell wall biosynthesis